MLDDFLGNLLLVVRSPFVHGVKDGAHGLAERSKRVLDAGRDLSEDLAVDEARVFHLAQVRRENLLANAGHGAAQLVKTHGAVEEIAQDHGAPAVGQKRECRLDGAGGQRSKRLFHGCDLDSFFLVPRAILGSYFPKATTCA